MEDDLQLGGGEAAGPRRPVFDQRLTALPERAAAPMGDVELASVTRVWAEANDFGHGAHAATFAVSNTSTTRKRGGPFGRNRTSSTAK